MKIWILVKKEMKVDAGGSTQQKGGPAVDERTTSDFCETEALTDAKDDCDCGREKNIMLLMRIQRTRGYPVVRV